MEEGLAAGSLSWQGAEGADGRFQVCKMGTVSVCECIWLLSCAENAAVLFLLLPFFQVDTKCGRFSLRDAKHRGEGVAESGGCFRTIISKSSDHTKTLEKIFTAIHANTELRAFAA